MPAYAVLIGGEATIESALTSTFTTIASQLQSVAVSVAPIALGIIGISTVVVFGIKLYKRITNKA